MPHKDPAAKRAYMAAYHKRRAANGVENARSLAWAKENPARRAATHHKSRLKRFYNMTPEDYAAMLEDQAGGCAVCAATPEELRKKLCVDHNHETGKVRGLLCDRCNTLLGKARENPAFFYAAVKYLTDWREKHKALEGA